jgi:hypothetical protein
MAELIAIAAKSKGKVKKVLPAQHPTTSSPISRRPSQGRVSDTSRA